MLIDLHRHLDGNIRPETILNLGQAFNIELPADNLLELRPHVQVRTRAPDLVSFLKKLDWGVRVLVNLSTCWRVAHENVEDLARQGARYGELRFSPYYMAMNHGLSLPGVVEAVIDGVRTGMRDFKIPVNLIGIMSRSFGLENCRKELEAILPHKDHFVGIDLAGDELNWPAPLFKEHFDRARDAGLRVTVHAGEADGPQSVWDAIKILGAERIGHGVRAIEDPKLVDYLVDKQIGLEVCLSSNVLTSTVPDLSQHPARQLLERGVLLCLNSDDPAVQNCDIGYEYSKAAPEAGFSLLDLGKVRHNALKMAWLSPSEKWRIRCMTRNIDRW